MNSLFKRTLEEIKENKKRREEGKIIAIPFPFKRFSYHVPGIQKGRYIIVTANSKVGKSKITDFLFMYSPVNYIIEHPECGAKVDIDYFTLEMSKSDKMKQYIAHNLYVLHGIVLGEEEIDSIYDRYILEDDILRKIEAMDPIMEQFEKRVTFVDHTKNPFGIYNYIRDKNEKNGNYFDKNNKIIPLNQIKNKDETISKQAVFAIDRYEPNDSDVFKIAIVDHVGLLTPEKGQRDVKEAIGKFSSKYSIRIRDRWKNIIVNVQQQAASQEGMDNIKLSMTKPSANGLGEDKTTQRDCDILLGLYAPVRYKIAEYSGYNILNQAHYQEPLLDNHRELLTIINRRGGGSVSTQLFFNGASNYFKELPSPNNNKGILALNQTLNKMREKKQNHV